MSCSAMLVEDQHSSRKKKRQTSARTSVNRVFQTTARDIVAFLQWRSYRGVMRRVRCGVMGADVSENIGQSCFSNNGA